MTSLLQMSSSRKQISHSPALWSQRSTHATSTPQVIPLRSQRAHVTSPVDSVSLLIRNNWCTYADLCTTSERSAYQRVSSRRKVHSLLTSGAIQEHPIIGEHILSKVDTYSEIARVVRHHHERVDGCGYPDGLAHDDIPLLARIIAVADAYDAMTSDRPYREAMPSRVARLRLAQAVESQFDTSVVAAFEAILAGASPAYRSGAGIVSRRENTTLIASPAPAQVA